MKNHLLILMFFLMTAAGFSQNGTLTGIITDKDLDNEPLPFANVSVVGKPIGTTADENGHYSLSLPAGDYTVAFSFLGYESAQTTVSIAPRQTLDVSQALTSESFKLADVVIQTQVNRERETALLLEQKNAVEFKQNIGAQELSRKGVGDVATALTKTSGITKQEGSGAIFVRGLGDRYNATTMNGLPVPSNDPEKKNIDLGLFSTDIVEYISIDKIYTPDTYGDFAGANVNIISKDFKSNRLFQVDIGASGNTNAFGHDHFTLPADRNMFGFDSAEIPANPLGSFGFSHSLTPEKTVPVSGNIALKAGRSFNVGAMGKLSLFASAGFENGYHFREGINQSVSAQGAKLKSFHQQRFAYSTSATGLFNAGYKINNDHRISYNFLLVNSSSLVGDRYEGFIRDIAEDDNGLVQRGTYTQNRLFVNQLLGKHRLSDRIGLEWGVSFNTIASDMPDRTQNTLRFNGEQNGYMLATNTTTDNHRYFQNMTEDEFAANASAHYKFGADDTGFKGKITAGYNGRFKKRDFEAIQFNFRVANDQRNTLVNPDNLDAFFNQQNFASDFFAIETFSGNTDPQYYSGEQNIHAGFASVEYKWNDKFTALMGLRAEQITQDVFWKTQLDNSGNRNKLEENELLPSVVLKYEYNDKTNLRLAASKTYTLPQFKERALFVYEDVTEVKVGNPFLYSSDDYNLDLKWEYFPENDEIVSATVFGKYIQNPINEVTLASSTNDISFLNTGESGYAVGVELELRKNLVKFGQSDENKLSAGFNAAYMTTNQDLDSDKVRRETNYNINLTSDEDSFTGASDLLLNADVSLFKSWNNGDSNLTATMAYAYFSDRLYALGTEMKGNLVDKAVGSLDLIVRSKFNKHFGVNLSAKNLLDPRVDRVQENAGGDVRVLSYKKGLNLSLGFSYEF